MLCLKSKTKMWYYTEPFAPNFPLWWKNFTIYWGKIIDIINIGRRSNEIFKLWFNNDLFFDQGQFVPKMNHIISKWFILFLNKIICSWTGQFGSRCLPLTECRFFNVRYNLQGRNQLPCLHYQKVLPPVNE
jgi:hypothetical protein